MTLILETRAGEGLEQLGLRTARQHLDTVAQRAAAEQWSVPHSNIRMPESIPKGLAEDHIRKALVDLDAGIEHPFGSPTGYELVHDGKKYPPKAVIGIAFRHLNGEILSPDKFSGGEAPGQANYELRRLGFQVVEIEKVETEDGPGVWSQDEINLLLADYFDMLRSDLLGQEYNKAAHNRLLRERLPGRSRSSVEFKHQNVSAVLLKLGIPCIDGYKPAKHYQNSLVDAVNLYLESNPSLFMALTQATEMFPAQLPNLGDWKKAFAAPPEAISFSNESYEPWRSRKGQKIDFVERDAANRKLGKLGERFAVLLEQQRLLDFGRDDLAKKVELVSETIGDGLGYDVLSFDEADESERWIEVKTTVMGKYSPFFVTSNEVRCSEAMARHYYLYRLFRFTQQQPRLYVLHGALSALCMLEPVAYKAIIGPGAGT
jgi:hypothetical protein